MARFALVTPSARAFLVTLLAVLLVSTSRAQMPPSSSTTSTPVPGAGHDYLGEIGETMNPASGSVSIRLNAMVPTGRGLTLPFSFAYDSNGVNYVGNNSTGILTWLNPSTTVVSTGGWSNSVPVASVSQINWTAQSDTEPPRPTTCFGFVNYVYQDAKGSRHNLNLTTYNEAGLNPAGACTYDGAHFPPGFSAEVVTQGGDGNPYDQGAILASIPASTQFTPGPITVTEPDGTVANFPTSLNQYIHGSGTTSAMATAIEDRNGNFVTINAPVYPATAYSYSDTAGRTVLQDSGFAVSPETVTIAGLGGSYTLDWASMPTPTFVAPVTALSGSDCGPIGNRGWEQQWELTSLTLPNGKIFTFTYDPTYSVISKMTYPNGGYIRYVWGLNDTAEWGENQSDQPNAQCAELYAVPVITDRYESFNGSTEVLHQHFVYSTTWNYGSGGSANWTSKTTTVTTTDNVRSTNYQTVYTYHPLNADIPPNTSSGPTNWDPVEYSVAYYDTNGSLLKTVYKTWASPTLLATEKTQYANGQESETAWSYNTREQETEKDDYDFGTSGVGALLRKTVTNYQQFNNTPLYPNAPSIVNRPCQVITYDSTGTNRVAETDSFYDNGATTTVCGTAGTPSVTSAGGSTLTGHDETNYSATSTNARGNLTQKTQWLNTGTGPVTTYTYDETGQVLSMTDPCGNATCSDMTGSTHTTSYSYTDNFVSTNLNGFTTTAGSAPSGEVTNAYLTQITYPTTNSIAHVENYAYGYNDGEVTNSTDENSQLTIYRYNDSLGRLTETDFPDGGETSLSYNDSVPSVTTTKLINSSVSLTTTTSMDGLGHPVQTQLTTDPDGITYTATSYDGLGRKYQSSNPYRTTSDPTYGITTYTYDALGRTTEEAKPDGSTVNTAYSGNQTTVTDEVGNQRTSQNDGLARLTGVWEGPNNSGYNYPTSYVYDPLNNLTSVTQNGSNSSNARTRSFVYDSLARITSAENPESGTITYSYDPNSNLLSKIAPRANQTGTLTETTNYSYDVLNRLTQKSFVGLTLSSEKYGYDGTTLTSCGQSPPTITSPTNLIGRRSAMCAGESGSSWSYDSMGRPLLETRINAGGSNQTKYSVTYAYNLDGSVKTLTYPSGDVITYTPGGAGRPLGVSDSTNTYVASGTSNHATYAPNGSLAGMANGYTSSFAGIVTANIYNDRLQPILYSAGISGQSSLFSLCYDFHLGVAISQTPCSFNAYPTGDNGNVFQVFDNEDSSRNAGFQYDPLNRLYQANTVITTGANCWGEVYTIDAWSNLTNRAGVSGMTGCLSEPLSASVSTQNQLSILTYDAAGNVTNDGNGNQPTYDAENRIATDAGVTYYYDADGKRMEKSSGTKYWFGPGGEVLTETGLTGTINEEYVYFNGARIARIDRPSGMVHYYFSDELGSAGVITDASGNIEQQYFYYPYGGLVSSIGSDSNHYKFTGKERDTESNLDNFGARYYTSNIGRFMTPDWAIRPTAVPYAVFGDPQSLNLYTYVRNDPVTRADVDGHGDGFGLGCGGPKSGDKKPSFCGTNAAQNTGFWGHLKAAFAQTTTKVMIGIGLGGKVKVGPGEVKLEAAAKVNVAFSAGKLSVSKSVDFAATAGKWHREFGLGASAEQVVGSVNVDTGTRGGVEPATGETTVLGSTKTFGIDASREGGEIGGEEGEGALGGGSISITREGLSALGEAWNDLVAGPSPPPPPTPGPPN